MNILVTGATGFVGSHLCHHLDKLGHKVYALYRSDNKFHHILFLYFNLKTRSKHINLIRYIQIKINDNI